MSKEVKQWITVEGNHVPIFEGQSKKEAVSNFMKHVENVNKDEDKKEKQIQANKKEADRLNGKKNDGIKHMTADEFNKEAKRQGIDISSEDIEEYVTSSYGGVQLGDKISKLIDNAPEEMKIHDKETYRGMYFNSKAEYEDFLRKHTEGKILESRRDGLSWTTDKKIAEEFSSGAGDYSVILIDGDDDKNAISIRGFADTPVSSSEVLYSSSQDFEIEEVQRKGNKAIIYVTAAAFSKRKYKDGK